MAFSNFSWRNQKNRISLFIILCALFFTLLNCSGDSEPETIELPSDQKITQAVEAAFNKADAIPENNIEINTAEGIPKLFFKFPDSEKNIYIKAVILLLK